MNGSREDIVVSALASLIAEKVCACEDFNQSEQYALDKTMELLRDAFSCALETFDQIIFEEKDPAFHSKGFERRTLMTTFGAVSYSRRRYNAACGNIYLADEALGMLANVKITPLLTSEVARLALDQSYRSASESFARYLGERLSKMTVKAAIAQNAAALDRAGLDGEKKRKVPVLDVEADGTYVALQRTRLQKKSDPIKRRRARREVSVMSAYEGKARDRCGDKKRVNVLHHASSKQAKAVWAEFVALIEDRWDTASLFYVNLATDGDVKYEAGTTHLTSPVSSGYDLRHIVSALAPAFGAEAAREIYSVMRGEGFALGFEVLCDYAEYFFEQTGEPVYLNVRDFIASHKAQIEIALRYNLGTIEGTNAHLIASRLKRFGGGWSSGLEPMVRLKAAQACGRRVPLVSNQTKSPLGEVVKARMLIEIEERISFLESRAKGLSHRGPQRSASNPIFYRQVIIPSSKAREVNHNYLHLWN